MISNGIDGILAFFEEHSVIGMMNLQPHSEWMLYMFAVIDIAVTYMFSPDTMKQKDVLLKIVRYGFFLFIIQNFQDMANMLFKTFATAGSVAASGSTSAVALSPGALWNKGFETVQSLFGHVFSINPFTTGFGLWFLTILAICFTAIATFKMVFQFLEMKIEFCVFSSIAVFFIPFTCVNQLSFLFQRIVTGFFSSLTKIMVMYFMLALVQTEISNFSIAVEADVTLDTVNYALRFLVLGLIVAQLPQFAANIMSGSSSMGGSIGSFATGMAVGAMKAPIAATAMAAGGVQQYKDRINKGGESKSQAARHTAGAIFADLVNKATGDPAGKIWFPNYDKGHSQTLRRSYPYENTPKQENTSQKIAQKQQDDINVSKINFSGKRT